MGICWDPLGKDGQRGDKVTRYYRRLAISVVAAALCALSMNAAAEAKGVIKGAAKGAAVGHFVGHGHAKAGAMVGAVHGHHHAMKKAAAK
jgi:hypothetical protein